MNMEQNKMWLELSGEPLFVHALKPFLQDERCKHIVIVCREEETEQIQGALDRLGEQLAEIELVHGGSERQYSVRNGLRKCGRAEIVLVHDGARPFVTRDIVDRLLVGVREVGAAICGVQVKDTVKRVKKDLVAETLPREDLWQVQTPQAFKRELLVEAHEFASTSGFLGTDEASLVERLFVPIKVVLGSYLNMKVTTPEDLLFARVILDERGGDEQ